MSFVNFDPFDDNLGTQGREPLKPFWTIDYENNEINGELHSWLKDSKDELQNRAETRIFNMKVNLAAYRGAHYKNQDNRRSNDSEPRPTTFKNPRLFDNQLYDLTEAHVASIGRFEPAVDVEAKDQDEWQDRVTAFVSNEIFEDFGYKKKLKNIYRTAARYKRIMGESYIMLTWDKDIGPLHPSYKKLMKENDGKFPRIPVINDEGDQVMSQHGEPLFHDKPIRIGDFKTWINPAFNHFLDIRPREEDCQFAHYRELVYADELKTEYPNIADKIVAGEQSTAYDPSSNDIEPQRGRVWKWTFIHRSTKDIARGRKIVYTENVILENTDNPYIMQDEHVFPWVRWTDIDVPEVLSGVSVYENGKLLQKVINNLYSMITRNQVMFSHPKWMTPKGAKIHRPSLGNDGSIVEYMGAVAPMLAQANPTPSETFSFLDKLETRLSIAMEKHPVSQGEPPKGITAGVALQFLEEMESEREDEQMAKYFDVQVKVAQKIIGFASIFYKANEERLEGIVGRMKAKKFLKDFDFGYLNRPFTIKVKNSPALPKKKSSRMQYILDFKERFPHLVSDKYTVDMLGFGNDKSFKNAATQSINEAMKENNDLIMFGSRLALENEPKPYEDHLLHYEMHLETLRDYGKDTVVPLANVKALIQHIEVHEMMMYELAEVNPMFAQKIMQQFDNFPIYYKTQVPLMQLANPMPQQPPAMAGPPPSPAMGQPMNLEPPIPTETGASSAATMGINI